MGSNEELTKWQVIANIKNGVYGFGTDKPDNKKFREDLMAIGFDLTHCVIAGADLRGADPRLLERVDLMDAGGTVLRGVRINENQVIQFAVATRSIDLDEIRNEAKWSDVIVLARAKLEKVDVIVEKVKKPLQKIR